MNLSDASNYDIFSATIDGEYSPEQIRFAAFVLDIPEERILGVKQGAEIVSWLEDHRDGLAKFVTDYS